MIKTTLNWTVKNLKNMYDGKNTLQMDLLASRNSSESITISLEYTFFPFFIKTKFIRKDKHFQSAGMKHEQNHIDRAADRGPHSKIPHGY